MQQFLLSAIKKFPARISSITLISLVSILFLQTKVQAQGSGIYESYAILNVNSSGNTFYDLQASSPNPDFDGATLGVFKLGLNTLVLNGAQNKIYKCNPCNILNCTLYYRIYKTSASPGSFTSVDLPFLSNDGNIDCGGSGGQNQTWQNNSASINVLSGLVPGNYTIEVYTAADYNGCGTGTNFSANGGSNYKATFTVTANVAVTSNEGTTVYATLAAAITAINPPSTIHTGPITVNVLAGYTETAPAGGYVITATGTAANSITFQKAGAGANPTFTASGSLSVGSINDAIFKIIGGDYITIDGFTMQENPANTVSGSAATNNMTEWGVALLYASTTNGAQNNTIQNNTISLNRTYANTFGIYSNTRHTATSVTVQADVTSAVGANSSNKVYNNTISNVNMGIAFIGTAAFQDGGNDIGGTSASTGNTLTNWGGAPALSLYYSNTTTSYCIFMNNQTGDNVSYNTLTSAAVTGTSVTLRGIFKNYTTSPSGTFTSIISNNTITMSSGFTSGTFECISSQGLSALSTATININSNTLLNNAVTGVASSTTIVGIINTSAPGILNINNNVFRGNTSTATSGGFTGISNTGTVVTTININANSIGNASGGAITFSAATTGGTVGVNGITNSGGASTAALTIQANDFRGIVHSVAGSAAHTYIINSAATLSQTIGNNTFTSLNVNTTGSVTFISNNVQLTSTSAQYIVNNAINISFNKSGAGGTVALYFTSTAPSSPSGSIKNEQNNNFSNITLTSATTMAGWLDLEGASSGGSTKTISGNTFTNWTCGSGAVNVIQTNYSGNNTAISNNTISNITGTGSITAISIGSSNAGTTQTVAGNIISSLASNTTGGAVVGITGGSTSITTLNINGNTLNTFSSAGAATSTAIAVTAGTTVNVFKNKIYDISGTSGSTIINGISVSSGTTVNVYNNLVGDLRATAANAANSLIGLNITGGTTVNAYFNTIYLNATSSGALFGSSAVFASTTPTVTFRNNIFDNTSTPVGATGFTVAYRRGGTTLSTYGSTSNNNDFYAGTPGALRLIYYDGTNSDQTLAAYKTRVAPRDNNSITENPPFLSTNGSSVGFLHIDPTVPTQLESGGQPISGITDDYDGQTRNTSTPDIGADEFNGTLLDAAGPTITYTPLGNTCTVGPRTLTATITDPSGVPTSGIGVPILYWKVNSGSYNAAQGTSTGSNQYQFAFGGTATSGDVVSYYIVAQDNANNVSVSPSTGASGLSANPPIAATPPTTPSTYTLTGTLSGTKTVGVGGDYPTLTDAVAAYNNSCVSGGIIFNLISSTYSASETFPITINANANASASNTLTIKPASGIAVTISSTTATSLIKLNGADYVTIDGLNTGSSLTLFNNNTTGSSEIWIGSASAGDGATNNTIKNCNLSGNASTTTLAGIVVSSGITLGSAAEAANNNNTIQGCKIVKQQNGIYTNGNATTLDQGMLITQNTIGSTSVTADKLGLRGILVQNAQNLIISNNTVTGVITSTTSTSTGIAVSSGINGGVIFNNKISDIKNLNTGGYGSNGMALSTTTTASNLRVYNNFISDVASYGYASGAAIGDNGYGMIVTSGGGYGIYYNSISLNTNQTVSGLPAAFNVTSGVTIAGALDVRNNIFSNTETVGTERYSIYVGATANVFSVINYNDYWYGAAPNLGFLGSNRTNLAAWQTATSKDANSKFVDPKFISATNLHLHNSSPLDGMSTPITGITTDIDGDTRDVTNPDIGADEFTGCVAPTASASSNSSVCEGETLNLMGTTNTGTSFAWTGPNGFTSNQQNPSITNVTSAAAGTYTFTASLGVCSSSGATTMVVINPLPTAVTVSPATSNICEDGSAVQLTATGGNVSGTNTILSQDFNDATNNWTTVNNSTGGTVSAATWILKPDGYTYNDGSTTSTFHSNDNSQFYISNSDVQGSSGTLTSTQLVSPAFSTVGYTSVTVNFFHNYRASGDAARVEASTDGTTWTILQTYTTTQGSSSLFAAASVNLTAPFSNQPTVYVRFRYASVFGYWWAIDNVSITGQGAQQANITWSPNAGLYNDAGATSPYTGTTTSTVYAKPSSLGPHTYSADATSNGCTTTSNSAVVVVNEAATAYAGPNQTICYDGVASVTGTIGGSASSGSWSTNGDGTFSNANGFTTNYTAGSNDKANQAVLLTFTTDDPTGPCSAATDAVAIIIKSQLLVSATADPIACNGGTTTVTVTASGGTGPYTGTGTFSNVPAGTYTKTVTDANGCSASSTITITEPTELNASATTGTIDCHGGTTSVMVTATGGTPPYSGVGTVNNVPAGTYPVTVTDDNGCSTTISVTVTEPTAITVTVAAGTIDCNGGTTNVVVTAGGGTGPYTGDGVYTDQDAGPHTYTVTDANGCTKSKTINISEPTAITVTANASTIDCNGGTTSVSVLASGGTPPYTGTGVYTNQDAGSHTYTVTDANGCTKSKTINIIEPTAITVIANASPINCSGGTTSVFVSASGGTPPYTGTGVFNNQDAGSHTYTVTDDNGCTQTKTITINEPTAISVTATAGTINCNGGTTSVVVSASGGTPPYTGTGVVNNQDAGSHTYTVTDDNGCMQTKTININEPTAITVTATAGPINCNGGTTSVLISASGGTPPYTGTGVMNNQDAGAHTYTVADANGCSATKTITISEPSAIAVTASAGTIQCQGGTTSVVVSASGGTPPYTGDGVYTNQTAGSHTYTVTDDNGCTQSTSISIANGTGTAPATPGAITGKFYNLCGGGTYTYTINPVPGATSYIWTAPTNFVVQNNGTSATIAIPSSFTGTAIISVKAVNNCGTSAARTLTLYAVAPDPSSAITGPSNVTTNQTGVIYKAPLESGITYTWQVPPGATIVNGQRTHQIKVNFGTSSGYVRVTVSNPCGNSPQGKKYVTVGGTVKGEQPEIIASILKAYPNPTASTSTVLFSSAKQGSKFEIVLRDVAGKSLINKSGIANLGENQVVVDLSKYANGMYLVTLITENESRTLKLYREN